VDPEAGALPCGGTDGIDQGRPKTLVWVVFAARSKPSAPFPVGEGQRKTALKLNPFWTHSFVMWCQCCSVRVPSGVVSMLSGATVSPRMWQVDPRLFAKVSQPLLGGWRVNNKTLGWRKSVDSGGGR